MSEYKYVAFISYQRADEEWAKFDAIAALSNGLVPLEEAAMEAAAGGDAKAAMEAVFGQEYEDAINSGDSKRLERAIAAMDVTCP